MSYLVSFFRALRRRVAWAAAATTALSLSMFAAPSWRSPVAQSLVRGFATDPLAADSLRPVERNFLEKAAAMSREHLNLARLAVSQATGTEVRDFAQQLAVDHRALAHAMTDLQRRKGTTTAPANGDPEVLSETYQRVAQQAGSEFDRAFIRVLAEMQSEFMAIFEQAATESKDDDVRALVGGFLPTLREHQNRVSELRKALE